MGGLLATRLLVGIEQILLNIFGLDSIDNSQRPKDGRDQDRRVFGVF